MLTRRRTSRERTRCVVLFLLPFILSFSPDPPRQSTLTPLLSQVSAMPTFVFVKNERKVHQVRGADVNGCVPPLCFPSDSPDSPSPSLPDAVSKRASSSTPAPQAAATAPLSLVKATPLLARQSRLRPLHRTTAGTSSSPCLSCCCSSGSSMPVGRRRESRREGARKGRFCRFFLSSFFPVHTRRFAVDALQSFMHSTWQISGREVAMSNSSGSFCRGSSPSSSPSLLARSR